MNPLRRRLFISWHQPHPLQPVTTTSMRSPSPSSGASKDLSTPNSIRSSSVLLRRWGRLSMHFEMLILTRPDLCQKVVDTFAEVLKGLDNC